jgi:hypothetical protein
LRRRSLPFFYWEKLWLTPQTTGLWFCPGNCHLQAMCQPFLKMSGSGFATTARAERRALPTRVSELLRVADDACLPRPKAPEGWTHSKTLRAVRESFVHTLRPGLSGARGATRPTGAWTFIHGGPLFSSGVFGPERLDRFFRR